ncbi:type VII secretion-associated serine protease mycosin [Streptomyces sp. NPDC102467]|uniref:type VII secretion-associated serine protease mycosin n=1 Tax=Streptomyces sp. NPDC102467 TaxID=3366179 RepID=UPI00381EFEE7
MPASRNRHGRAAVASAALGLLLVGLGSAPALAGSTRDAQWYLTAMQAENMWRTSKGQGVTVAVLDSGVETGNPDLQGRVLDGLDLAPEEAGDEHTDYNGHGTSMAGLIAATGAAGPDRGAFGLAPGARILPIRIPDGGKANNQFQSSAQFGKAGSDGIRYAVDHGAKIINISLGLLEGSTRLTEAVDYALKNDALVFAATGNSGKEGKPVEFPAATPGVVGVGAVGKDLRKTAESTSGPEVDIAAPGDEMVHACGSKSSGTGLCTGHGTSDATAVASASAALIWSEHPNWTNNQVLRVMLNTIGAPTDGAKRNDAIGYGIVRPRVALKSPGDPGPANEYPLPDYPVGAGSPSSDASEATGAQVPEDKGADGVQPDSDNTGLWIGIGAGVAVLVAAGVAVAVVRKRRRVMPPSPMDAPYGQSPYGRPYSAPQQFTGPQAYGPPPRHDQNQPPRHGD